MPRAKFQTLTEQMFYILMCLKNECCGTDIMEKVRKMTNGRIVVGPGTLYNLLEQFVEEDLICETKIEGRKRSYILTDKGKKLLETEYNRICTQAEDFRRFLGKENDK
ncbi:MAG: helix-turn-helix transcriptional regulator [Clostridia bacterium]|nr:helix-turn-helix transcriptional regulator [Clostridia bacterium]